MDKWDHKSQSDWALGSVSLPYFEGPTNSQNFNSKLCHKGQTLSAAWA